MPPKLERWRTLSRVATSPFRKSNSSRDSPSRKGSMDVVPPSESPTPAVNPRPPIDGVANDAPAVSTPLLSNPLPISNPNGEAVDLSSPVEAEMKIPPIPGPDQSKDDAKHGVAPEPDEETKDAALPAEAAETPPATQGAVPEAEAASTQDTTAKEEPSVAQETSVVKDEPKHYEDIHGPEPVKRHPFAYASADVPKAEEVPQPQVIVPVPGLEIAEIVEDEDPGVTISSPPVGLGSEDVIISKPPPVVKPALMTPEATPEHTRNGDSVADERSEYGDVITRTIHVDQAADAASPKNSAFADDEDILGSKDAVATSIPDPLLDSQTLLAPHGEANRAHPYTLPSVQPLAAVTPTRVTVQVDNDENVVTIPAQDTREYVEYNGLRTGAFGSPRPYSMELSRWTAYSLPNGAKYFYHSEAHIVTDVDISVPSKLIKVAEHLDQTMRAAKKQHKAAFLQERLVDDSTPAVTGGTESGWPTAKENARLKANDFGFGYGATAFGDEPVGAELWLREIGNEESFSSAILWVNHLSKMVSVHGPWEKTGMDEEDAIHATIRYWEFVETHPGHTGLPAGSAEEAIEALSWCYTDHLLHPFEAHENRPFTCEECKELLSLLKTLEAQSIGPLQTHIIAKIQVRLAQHRRHLHLAAHLPDGLFHHQEKQRKEPFSNYLVNALVVLFCFGIPFKYVARKEVHSSSRLHKRAANGELKRGDRFAAESPASAATVVLLAAVFVTSAIIFLTLPGLENASQLSILISLCFSAASLGSTIINLQRRAFGATKEHQHPFIASLPLVLLAWSIIALVTSVFLYVYRVSATPHGDEGEILNGLLRGIVVAVGSTLLFVLLISAFVGRR